MNQKNILPLLIILFLVILDQISKIAALKFLETTVNAQIAFDIPVSNKIMLFAAPLLLLIFILLAKKYFDLNKISSLAAVALIMSGGISNYIDRLIRGGVVDFIDLQFWPSFNLADTYLTIGVFCILFFYDRIIKKKNYD